MRRAPLSALAGSLFSAATAVWLVSCGNGTEAGPPASYLQSSDAARTRSTASTGAESVTYQVNAQHTGYVDATLGLPLTEAWSVKLGRKNSAVGYPVVANGTVVVAVGGAGKLVALDATTGTQIWVKGKPGHGHGEGWVGAAYDNGTIFANPLYTSGRHNIGMFAFDAQSGKQLWAVPIPGEWALSSPPTATAGTVYTGAAGDGGYVYAYAESSGALQWRESIENGDDSSPAVTSQGVYVSYPCQTYDFDPATGTQIWHSNRSCDGGGGSTPALQDGLLYVGDSGGPRGYSGLILNASSGTTAGHFNSYFMPAFAQHRGFFVTDHGSKLRAFDVPSMHRAWSVTLRKDKYATPPIVVGRTVYVEASDGKLFGYDVQSGRRSVEFSLGYVPRYMGPSAALGFGSNELVVPDGNKLIAIKGS
jgi:outer membrane protein assembly factor BamB